MLTGLTGVVLTWMDPAMPKIFPPSLAKVKTSDGLLICQCKAASTPIISNGKVFITTTDKSKEELLAVAYDLKSGKKLWSEVVGKGLTKITGLIMLEPHL